jgi:hypothetical protein
VKPFIGTLIDRSLGAYGSCHSSSQCCVSDQHSHHPVGKPCPQEEALILSSWSHDAGRGCAERVLFLVRYVAVLAWFGDRKNSAPTHILHSGFGPCVYWGSEHNSWSMDRRVVASAVFNRKLRETKDYHAAGSDSVAASTGRWDRLVHVLIHELLAHTD